MTSEVIFETPTATIVFDVKISGYGRVGVIECRDTLYYYVPEGEVYNDMLEFAGIQIGHHDVNELKNIVEKYYKNSKYFQRFWT